MTVTEFINAMAGVPWVERKASFTESDCWGVVVLFMRHVHSIELVDTVEMPINDAMSVQLDAGGWHECKEEDAVVFMAYVHGLPKHCGIVVNGLAVHSGGGRDRAGFCRVDRLAVLQAEYRDIKYFKHKDIK